MVFDCLGGFIVAVVVVVDGRYSFGMCLDLPSIVGVLGLCDRDVYSCSVQSSMFFCKVCMSILRELGLFFIFDDGVCSRCRSSLRFEARIFVKYFVVRVFGVVGLTGSNSVFTCTNIVSAGVCRSVFCAWIQLENDDDVGGAVVDVI